MSWSFKKVGLVANAAALKAAVDAEQSMPVAIREEVNRRIDDLAAHKWHADQALLVDTFGHLETEPRQFRGCCDLKINVQALPFCNAPQPTTTH